MSRPAPSRFHARRRHRRGVALIIILGCLIILSAVLLAFLSSAKTELVSSKMYSDNNDVHALVNTSVNLVMTQIRQATTATPTDCWTSQPGLIRTFNNSNPAAPDMSYKLYSSDTMQVTGALDPSAEILTLANWNQNSAVFTDLNQPSSGVYPILDPSASGTVQGYTVTSTTTITSTSQPVPMPVKWMYVLKDGTLVAPTPTAPGPGTSATISTATSTNPIVGRIAFWTDDETCKLNINTASEGMYWDVPHFHNTTETALADNEPQQYEYQGYPGHPATVSLSTVFPGLVSGTATATEYNNFYTLAPRIQSGGSLNGTVYVSTNAAPVVLDADRLYDSPDELDFNNSRLSNAGLTQTDLAKAKFFITAHNRAPETTIWGTPKVACWPINSDLAANANSLYATPFDRLIAQCSTLNTYPYYFQRKNKDSTTYDMNSTNIPRNPTVYAYLQTLMNTPAPGFGGTLATKFGADSDQILTEIFDYIRCTNLLDANLTYPATATNPSPPYYQFAPGYASHNLGAAEVAPITIGSTRGFGRCVTFSEAAIWLICTADPTNATSNGTGNLTLPINIHALGQGIPLTMTATSKQVRVEMALILDPFTPMHSQLPFRPDDEISITGLDGWTLKGDQDATTPPTNQNLQFPKQPSGTVGDYLTGIAPDSITSMFNDGGYMGATYFLNARCVRARNGGRLVLDSQFNSSIDKTTAPLLNNRQYPFVSEPMTVQVSLSSGSITFSGGPITVNIRERTTGMIQSASPTVPTETLQSLTINFPTMTMPVPALSPTGTGGTGNPWTFQASGCAVGPTQQYVASATSTVTILGRLNPYGPPYMDKVNDVIYGVVPAQGGQTVDPRLIAQQNSTTVAAPFSPHPFCTNNPPTHYATSVIYNPISGYGGDSPSDATCYNLGTLANIGAGNQYQWKYQPCPKVPYPAVAAMVNGDWDNGIGDQPDGGYLNEPDGVNIDPGDYEDPYFADHFITSSLFTSPSRTMPSPGMFGSLPVGVKRGLSWQTLLFRRQPAHPDYINSTSTGTVGVGNGNFINDPDYLMMDMFWMPVVEPYAISEALSTAGKVNMNYQIIPFNYIERSTGLYAVLKHEKVIAVPSGDFWGVYKNGTPPFGASNYRRNIQIPQTLTEFQNRFNNSDNTGLFAFRTPAEICDINLIPDDVGTLSLSTKTTIDAMMASYWSSHALTGDNCRERPYTTIYPHLTTRSNTFRVHYRVQTLKKAVGSTATVWNDATDQITSEGRGSVLIERYLDPNDPNIPDYAAHPTTTPSLESHYQFRVISVNRFAP